MTDLLSVHDMAERRGVSLKPEEVRVISATLSLISDRKDLPIGEKKYRTNNPNPNYERELAEYEQKAFTKKPRKHYGQSYNVKTFEESLTYYFTQMLIILEIE